MIPVTENLLRELTNSLRVVRLTIDDPLLPPFTERITHVDRLISIGYAAHDASVELR